MNISLGKKEYHVKTSLSSTKIGRRNIFYLIPKIFNFLPPEQKNEYKFSSHAEEK